MPGHAEVSWMTIIQTLSWAGAVMTAAIGAVGFIIGQKKARLQRKEEIAERKAANAAAEREYHWRQAGAAQASLEKMEADTLAADAMLMLDWDGRYFPSGSQKWPLRKKDVLRALRIEAPSFTEAETYVRDAFDRLLWHFERIQSQIDVELIGLRHVRFPLAYWVALMDEDRAIFDSFLTAYGYIGASRLMDAFRKEGLPKIAPEYEKLLDPRKKKASARPRKRTTAAGPQSSRAKQAQGMPPP
jgi:hypothetical protein